MIGRKGRDLVSIPVPQLDVPHFRFGENGSGGVGQGDGEVGEPIGKGGEPSDGSGQAGSEPGGGHLLEVEISLDELAAMLGDELELPRIEPKGRPSIDAGEGEVQQHPPDGPGIAAAFQADLSASAAAADHHGQLRARRSARRAGQGRQAVSLVERRSTQPQVNAVVIYMMDVSGSMTDEQKEIVRTEAFWIDAWLAQPVRRHREAVHHSRRGGEGSRRAHVLSHPRERRHADQLGLQGVRRI